eukprot:TRINITY_DN27499_c0_g1_i1.p1 TRINITY_DN27499_c0_g1~~TRINITY_DN27499_c0_g1_i1.p1  ORF type:complete len:601 (-),score=142.52 TRINITY_DN27499_c0_g1_i1:561-2117(-)
MARVVQQAAGDGKSPGSQGERGLMLAPPPVGLQLENLFNMFSDHHAGHIGLSQGSFEVDDDHETRVRISATLPGYELKSASESEKPLSVRAVGKKSLVITGQQQNGPIMQRWQRSFQLPKGSDIEKVSVTYSASSGNLTVEVPRKAKGEDAEADDTDEEEDERAGGDPFDDMLRDFLPPAMRAMQESVPRIAGNLEKANNLPAGRMRGAGPIGLGGLLNEIFGDIARAHPQFHPPPGGEQPVPDDAIVNLVGCYAESQFDKLELKYYGDSNAASFNAMYWHAQNDHVPYFAMSRHIDSVGHAFTAKGFAHEREEPRWGKYDGCGTRCEDSDSRWCGCANEAIRGFPNQDCQEGERRYAVYKIGNAVAATEDNLAEAAEGNAKDVGGEVDEDGKIKSTTPAAALGSSAPSVKWQLVHEAEDNGGPSIEITVPKGTKAEASGHKLLLFNDTAGEGANDRESDGKQGADTNLLGKVKLPAKVSSDSCKFDDSKASDSDRVLKCKLEQNTVRDIKIKVLDEL